MSHDSSLRSGGDVNGARSVALSRRWNQYQNNQHRKHEARRKREHRMQRMKVKVAVPVPPEMYQRLHESLLAHRGGCLSRSAYVRNAFLNIRLNRRA